MLRDDSIFLRRSSPGSSLDRLLPKSEHHSEEQRTADGPVRFALMVSGSPGDAQRYRCANKLEELAYLGLSADSVESNQVDYGSVLRRYEVFLLHRVQNSPQVERFIRDARSLSKPVIFDTDDLIFDTRPDRLSPTTRYMNTHDLQIHRDFVYRNGRTIELCDAAIVSTGPLGDAIRELFPGKTVFLHRNAASQTFLDLVDTVRSQYVRPKSDLVRIAFVSGSNTHKDDFVECVQPLRHLLENHPHVRLMPVGYFDLPPDLQHLAGQVDAVPPVPWYQVPLCYAMADINLAPLELNNRFAESKSERKYLEPALLELPTIASDIAPFRVGIRHGETGFLCANHEDWYQTLERLVLDAGLRARVGRAAREDVLERYTTRVRSHNLKQILDQIVGPRLELLRHDVAQAV